MRTLNQDYMSYLNSAHSLDYLLADPPWKFDDRPPKMRPQTGFTLWTNNVEGMKTIFSGSQRVLVDLIWLWCPVSLIDIPIKLSLQYGYNYKTTAVWRKLTRNAKEFYGCGHWLRNSVEFMILFTRLFHKRQTMRSIHRNLWSHVASDESTAKPREMELDIINSMVTRYGADTRGAYLFSGPNIECFRNHTIDCVDIIHGQEDAQQ